MTDTFDRRARAWLELGPSQVPEDAVDAVFAAIEGVAQDRPAVGTLGWQAPVRRLRQDRRLAVGLAVAATIVIAVSAGVLVQRGATETVGTTPSPLETLPADPTDLLAGYPVQPLALSKAVNGVPGAIPSDSPTTRVDLGRVRLDEPTAVAASCRGGWLLLQMAVAGSSQRFVDLIVNCDGRVVRQDLVTVPGTAGVAMPSSAPGLSDGQDVWITVTPGTSWRVAIAEYLPEVTARPKWDPIAGTTGWTRLLERASFRFGDAVGADVNLPTGAHRIGVFVECRGTGETSVGLTGVADRTSVSCPTSSPQRLEFDVTGGQRLGMDATISGPLFVRLVVEVDSQLGTTYPSAPALPPVVAETGYAVANGEYLSVGTIGSNRHTAIDLPGAQAGRPRGDLVTVTAGHNADFNAVQLDLWSIGEVRPVRTLVTVESPASIFGSSLDATHGQVFYIVSPGDTGDAELRRIGLDGTGETVLASFSQQTGTPALQLAADDSFYLLETCTAESVCTRRLIDTVTLETRTIEVRGGETCQVVAVLGEDLVVASVAPSCTGESPALSIVATAMDGSRRVQLSEASAASPASDGWVMPTAEGPRVLVVRHAEDGSQDLRSIDVASGASTVLWTNDGSQPAMELSRVNLPEDWVLLGSLWNDPLLPSGSRPVPLLINVLTGEQISMANLPH